MSEENIYLDQSVKVFYGHGLKRIEEEINYSNNTTNKTVVTIASLDSNLTTNTILFLYNGLNDIIIDLKNLIYIKGSDKYVEKRTEIECMWIYSSFKNTVMEKYDDLYDFKIFMYKIKSLETDTNIKDIEDLNEIDEWVNGVDGINDEKVDDLEYNNIDMTDDELKKYIERNLLKIKKILRFNIRIYIANIEKNFPEIFFNLHMVLKDVTIFQNK